ncbi:MAG: transcriptional repressor [Clostridiales bacterium]|nr:transcriptional repressor [Clostridiales bacterium]
MNQYRNSKQRENILSYIKSVKTHPTANVIYDVMKLDFPNLSMGTVYRNLQILSDQGEITKLDFGSTFDHYDGYTKEHSHFVCTSCQKVYDIQVDFPKREQVQKTTVHQIKGSLIRYYGLCQDCMKKMKGEN